MGPAICQARPCSIFNMRPTFSADDLLYRILFDTVLFSNLTCGNTTSSTYSANLAHVTFREFMTPVIFTAVTKYSTQHYKSMVYILGRSDDL